MKKVWTKPKIEKIKVNRATKWNDKKHPWCHPSGDIS